MTDGQKKLIDIRKRINNGDQYVKSMACDEMLQLIKQEDDDELKSLLAVEIVFVLIDLHRDTDWNFCYNLLYNSKEYGLKVVALDSKVEYYRHQQPQSDINGMLAAYEEELVVAQEEHDRGLLATIKLNIGKIHIILNQMDKALLEFNECIEIATQVNNHVLVAVATYFNGYILNKQGYKETSIAILREAAEIAFNQHDKMVTLHIETMRAYYQLEVGDIIGAQHTLETWYKQCAHLL